MISFSFSLWILHARSVIAASCNGGLHLDAATRSHGVNGIHQSSMEHITSVPMIFPSTPDIFRFFDYKSLTAGVIALQKLFDRRSSSLGNEDKRRPIPGRCPTNIALAIGSPSDTPRARHFIFKSY